MPKYICKAIKPGLLGRWKSSRSPSDFESLIIRALLEAGEATGYVIKCKDADFEVDPWCLYNSDFLLSMHKGWDQSFLFRPNLNFVIDFMYRVSNERFHVPNPIKARLNFEGECNKIFDLTEFRKAPIRIVFDALHGISSVRLNKSIVLS